MCIYVYGRVFVCVRARLEVDGGGRWCGVCVLCGGVGFKGGGVLSTYTSKCWSYIQSQFDVRRTIIYKQATIKIF